MSSISAESEKKGEDKISGTRGHADKFISEFALMARKLRKGGGDKYTPIIERQLGKIDAAIELLESYPQIATQYPETASGVHAILELLERKASEMEADDMLKASAKKVLQFQPGARINQLVKKNAGGLVQTAKVVGGQVVGLNDPLFP